MTDDSTAGEGHTCEHTCTPEPWQSWGDRWCSACRTEQAIFRAYDAQLAKTREVAAAAEARGYARGLRESVEVARTTAVAVLSEDGMEWVEPGGDAVSAAITAALTARLKEAER